jgi:curli production assembly/transport component CsgF
MKRVATILVFTFFYTACLASELVYQPVNPNFGGSPLNGNHLLSNAQAQDDHEGSGRSGYRAPSALERMTSSLESRLLGQLLADVGNGNTGSLSTEDFSIVVTEDVDGNLTVLITDLNTNESTEIQVNGLIPD